MPFSYPSNLSTLEFSTDGLPRTSLSAISGHAVLAPRASGTIPSSDSCRGFAAHFAFAYREAYQTFRPGPMQVSRGHTRIFRTVPPANTLVRWVNEKRLRRHSAGSTLPHLGPTRSSSGLPPSITVRYFSANPSDSASRRTPCLPRFPLAGEALPPPLDRMPLIRASEGLQPS